MIADPLSEREREILRLVALGATNQRIAHDLAISVNTVKVHIRNIFSKIGISSRAEAALYAARTGLVDGRQVPADFAAEHERDPLARVEPESQHVEDALAILRPGMESKREDGQSPILKRGPIGRTAVSLGTLLFLAFALFLTRDLWLPVANLAANPAPAATPLSSVPRWRELASLPNGRAAFALASFTVEGRTLLYAVGGESGKTVLRDVLRYDPTNNVWAPMSAKPTPVADVRAAVLGNRLYVPGGRLADGSVGSQLEAYDPQHDRWLKLAPMPGPRSGYAIATFEGKLYVFGGWNGREYSADVWQYNPDDDAWRTRTPMPSARAYAAAANLDQWIYVVGGEDASGPLSANLRYSPADDGAQIPWATKAPSLAPISRGDGTTVGGLLMMAGLDDDAGHLAVYNQQTDTWRMSDIPLGPVHDLRAQAIGNRLYFIGGRIGDTQKAGAFEYQVISTIFLPAIQ